MNALQTHTEIKVDRDGEIALITMNRPEKRNALSLQMMRELEAALAMLAQDSGVRAIVLRGDGPAFCAGHDLRELVDRDLDAYRIVFDACVDLMARIAAIPQPVIAEVAKVATAAGCQLVAACDLAVASTEATFATPGVRIGLFCSTPMVALTRAIGRKRAMEMLLTGDAIDAATALAWGLVNRVVAADRLHHETLAFARKITSSSRGIVGIGKAAFYAQIDLDQARAYEHTKAVMTSNALEPDAREGITAFFERRPPKWEGSGGVSWVPLNPDGPRRSGVGSEHCDEAKSVAHTRYARPDKKGTRAYATAGGLAHGEPFCDYRTGENGRVGRMEWPA